MAEDSLSRALQDNILTLACYSDKNHALIRNTVAVNLFTNKVYRQIVSAAYDYIDRYKKAPKDHIADELEEELAKEGQESSLMLETLEAARNLSTEVNEDYVVTQLAKFIRQQSLKVGIIKAHEAITQGDLDTAESVLLDSIKERLSVFSPGVTLLEVTKELMSGVEMREAIHLGIDTLDRLSLGPARKELHLFIAAPKRGKSWWLTHVTKRALMQRWKGVYVTLELGDKFVGMRQLQSIFALTNKDVEETYTRFDKDDDGKVTALEEKKLNRPSLSNKKVLSELPDKLDDLRIQDRLFIKEFPTGSLTVNGLAAYLDSLEQSKNFVPDFVVLDYADLMSVPVNTYRQSLGAVYKDLRGLAVDRNFALVTASQANRAGAGSKLVSDTHVAEDFSKIATADCVITYNQTPMERAMKLARLFVANGRVESDRFTTLVSQSYRSGQFALDSVIMRDEYWGLIGESKDEEKEDE